MGNAAPAQPDSYATREFAARKLPDHKPAELLAFAARKSGRGVFELTREQRRLKKGRGQLPMQEYVHYGVYDTTRHSAEDQSRFITNARHWPITHKCCDMTWQATTEDKWLTNHILKDTGIAIPETLAVIDRGPRLYPGTRKLDSAEALQSFLSGAHFPIFGKVNRGIVSAGVILIEGADSSGVSLRDHGHMPYHEFLHGFVGGQSYILQPLVQPHGFFHQFTRALPTVRVCILLQGGNVHVPFTALKLPASDQIADSFWRPGNLACDIDPETGTIRTARTKAPMEVIDHETHPDTGAAILGQALPHWDAVRAMAAECARMFTPLRYQSMDVAITDHGPVLIEINTGGGFDLPQFASGRGFLTDEVLDFFAACGVPDL